MKMKGILFRTLRALLMDMKAVPAQVGYHSNTNNARFQSLYCVSHSGFRVPFEGEDYYVRLNEYKEPEKFEILLGTTPSESNHDITITEAHFDSHSLLEVKPSLKRCGGSLTVEPKSIGSFPARVTNTKNRFIVGFPDAALFPSLFRLCRAKMLSIEASPKRKNQPKTNP